MPIAKGEKKTDAQRRAENKYKSANYDTLATHAGKELSGVFRSRCSGLGLTVSGALGAFVRALAAGDPAAVQIVTAARSGASDPEAPEESRSGGA